MIAMRKKEENIFMEYDKLGKLEKVDPRSVWKDEALDFTPWLAQEENLALLGDEIGVNIKLIRTEASVGNFSVDILAEEEGTGRKIVIENQLEPSNHDHLGKVITYASGYDAKIAIWIVREAREEHKRAIDWLNEHTDEDVNFFLIKMELWKVNNSLPAPKFEVISRPNNWSKSIKKGLSEIAMKEIDFLNGFVEYCNENNSILHPGTPSVSAPAYYTISTGSSKWIIEIKINTQSSTLMEDVSFAGKELFRKLEAKYKDAIENEMGVKLCWEPMENYKKSQVSLTIKDFDIDNLDKREEYYKWLKDNGEKFKTIFSKYINKISRKEEGTDEHK